MSVAVLQPKEVLGFAHPAERPTTSTQDGVVRGAPHLP